MARVMWCDFFFVTFHVTWRDVEWLSTFFDDDDDDVTFSAQIAHFFDVEVFWIFFRCKRCRWRSEYVEYWTRPIDDFLDVVIWPRRKQKQWYHSWPDRPTGTLRVEFTRFAYFRWTCLLSFSHLVINYHPKLYISLTLVFPE